MRAVVRTTDGRTVELDARASVIADLLVSMRAHLATIEFGSLEFHIKARRVRAQLTRAEASRLAEDDGLEE